MSFKEICNIQGSGGAFFLGNRVDCQIIFREQGNTWLDVWDQGNTNLLSIIIIKKSSAINKRWNKQTNVGNNGIQSWGSREWHKSFWDQANLSLKRIMEQVVLLLGNKG